MMDNPEVNILVAEKIMGWSSLRLVGDRWLMGYPFSKWETFAPELDFVPRYSTDIAAAWQAEEKIKELGLGMEYAKQLYEVTQAGLGDFIEEVWWIMIHATPEQRCRAALRAVGVEVE